MLGLGLTHPSDGCQKEDRACTHHCLSKSIPISKGKTEGRVFLGNMQGWEVNFWGSFMALNFKPTEQASKGKSGHSHCWIE